MWFGSVSASNANMNQPNSSSSSNQSTWAAHSNLEIGSNSQGAASSIAISADTNNNNGDSHKISLPKSTVQVPQLSLATLAPERTASKQNNNSSSVPEKISFHLKTSIFTRRVTIDSEKMALGLIKQLAMAFLNEIYFQGAPYPSGTYVGDYIRRHFGQPDNLNQLYDRLVLRKYNPSQESFLPFNSVSDIEPESYICIEVSEKQPSGHLLSFISSSSASNAGATSTSTAASSTNAHQAPPPTAAASQGNCSGGPNHHQVRISHEFKSESLFMTHCSACTNLIGAFRQGYQCVSCKRNFCPKCKIKAETSGDSCLAPAGQPTVSVSQSQQQAASSSSQCQASSSTNQQPSSNQSSQAQQQQQLAADNPTGAGNGKLDAVHSNMSKRKSATNLLHFNIANPFKSHHSQQQQQQQQPANQQNASKEDRAKMRGSAGALDPILQQLSRSREQAQNSPSANDNNQHQSNLMVVQNAQISSSHQNLFTQVTGEASIKPSAGSGYCTDEVLVGVPGSLSVHQSPIGSANKAHGASQLSNSARTSVNDLHAPSPTGKTTRDHLFICMDWIQISGEPLCGVCSKVLKSQQQQSLSSSSAPFTCKNCKLQVHAHCQDLVLTDCLTRIAESSRAAAERQDSSSSQLGTGGGDKTSVMNTNSNVSRDNIRLRRLVPSVKHVKRPDSTKPIIEGWLKHTTLSDEQARQHYWRLDETDITLYENDTSRRYFKAIALNKITRVVSSQSIPKRVKEDILTTCMPLPALADSSQEPAGEQQRASKSATTSPMKSPQLQAQMKAMFAFELASGSMYLVQANSETEASKWLESLATVTAQKQQQQQDKAAQDQYQVTPVKAGGAPAPATTKPQAKQEGEPATVKRLVEFVNDICIDKDPAANKNAVSAAVEKSTAPTNPVTDHKAHASPTNNRQPAQAIAQVAEKQVPQITNITKAPVPQRQHHHHHHHYPPSSGRGLQLQSKTYTDPARSRLYNRPRKTIQIDPMSIPDHWIVGKYLIERDRATGHGFEELGSGQFGKVYAAISEIKNEDKVRGMWSGVPVAIKEISKVRFDLRQQEKLKNEANILSQLDHPGVIILERVHDLPDKIYIVMEQLEDDMLEMIVSTEEKRLNERVTKFLTYQILEALKYLHQKHIAHCDLKPENVLLVERRCQFPQIKLCDFGFAKIIEDNSFRSSLVGTPAYLAPEVVKGERYNRSVDLWSVGVIVYVSLSGEFPFNEGESIHDQISRANFMYPKNPWDGISSQAKNFINSLLRVNCEKRLSASRAQMDDWIQDYQLWCDLTELEVRVGRRWVTDDADFERWSRYAREHSIQLPRSAIQLHENLLAD